jgi:hypothetical protein
MAVNLDVTHLTWICSTHCDCRGVSDNDEMGYLNAQVGFEEDLQHLFLSDNIHDAPTSPPEALSVQRLGEHIARFTAIIDLINLWYGEYCYLMEWQEPLITLAVFIGFLYFTVKVKAEYALSGVMFTCVVLMTRTLIRRRSGAYVKRYVELGAKGAPKLDYKPVAKLRLSVLGFRSRDKRATVSSAKPSMRVSFVYMPESAAQAETGPDDNLIGYFGPNEQAVGFAVPEAAQGVSQLVSNMVGAEVVQKDAVVQSQYESWPIVGAVKEVNTDGQSGLFIPSEAAELSLLYPVLQPVAAKVHAAAAAVAKVTKVERSGTPSGSATNAGGESFGSAGSSKPSAAQVPASTSSSVYLPWDRNESSVKIAFTDESSFGTGQEGIASLTVRDIVQGGTTTVADGRRYIEVRKWCVVSNPKGKSLSKVNFVVHL